MRVLHILDHSIPLHSGYTFRTRAILREQRALGTWALGRADAVTTICEGLRKDIVGRGIPADKVTVIPNAVDIDKFSVGGSADLALKEELGLSGTRLVGFIGSFYAYEGLDVL